MGVIGQERPSHTQEGAEVSGGGEAQQDLLNVALSAALCHHSLNTS
jgi:hypothetical protein